MSPTSFSFEPLYLALAVVAAVAYARAARGDRPGPWRATSFGVGLFLIAASLNSPLETIAAHYLLLIHLLQNALIADIAPVLLLLGLTPSMCETLGRTRLSARLRPQLTLPLWLVCWYGTHVALFYEWALREGWALNVEHGILIAAGLAFWWPLLSGRLAPPVALAYLGAGFVSSAFLGLAYIFSRRPFYSFYEHAPRLWGFSPARDQNLGGVLMNTEQTIVFLAAIAFYLWKLLEEEHVSGSRSPADGSRAAG